MNFVTWVDSKATKMTQQMHWLDIGLLKLGIAAFTLLMAKLWEPLLGFEWYWYVLFVVPGAMRFMYVAFRK